MAGIEFRAIADALTAEQFARHELQMRGNRARCPFHGGERFNLQFFQDGKCYCHVCHAGGDVIKLAAATWHTSQQDAARQLNDVYHLGVAAETMTQAERDRRDQQRQAEREQQEKARHELTQEWGAACDAAREASAALERFTPADADKPEFTTALARLCAAQTQLDVMWSSMTAG